MSELFPYLLTVTELTSQIRLQLEQGFPLVWVEGEVSNVRCPSSGHRYFTLKDQSSQIRAVLFRTQADRLKFHLMDGLGVIACGRLSVYEPRGDYQLLLEVVEPKGVGERQLAFLQLKTRLEQEGLFDPKRKKPLPVYPERIGIVTSSSGAAIHDLLTVLQRRWPRAHLVLIPVAVQGEKAPFQLKEAIQTLNILKGVEVMIVGRGGGSVEDLWAFNDEGVVRAIAASRVPVMSAVGHETDVTLTDFAADCRAPTPSAAAELVVPDGKAVRLGLEQHRIRLSRMFQRVIGKAALEVLRLERQLPEPRLMIGRYSQRVDDLEGKLHDFLKNWYRNLHVRLLDFQSTIWEFNPKVILARRKDRVGTLGERNQASLRSYLKDRRHATQTLIGQLHQLSPLGVLERGYSIVKRTRDEKILKDSCEVFPGETVHVKLHRGSLICLVNESESPS